MVGRGFVYVWHWRVRVEGVCCDSPALYFLRGGNFQPTVASAAPPKPSWGFFLCAASASVLKGRSMPAAELLGIGEAP